MVNITIEPYRQASDEVFMNILHKKTKIVVIPEREEKSS